VNKLIAISFLIWSLPLFSQNTIDTIDWNQKGTRNIVKTNPLVPIWGAIPLTSEWRLLYEMPFSHNQSFQIGASYLGKSPILKLAEDSMIGPGVEFVVKGFRLQGGYKFYFTSFRNYKQEPFNYIPLGFYVSPHISYSTATFTTRAASVRNVYIQGTHYNINFLLGYQYYSLVFDNLVVDLFIGFGWKENYWEENINGVTRSSTLNTANTNYYGSNFKFSLGFNVGFRF
jgi:hypothetical protein